jgi:hypothetical protein
VEGREGPDGGELHEIALDEVQHLGQLLTEPWERERQGRNEKRR